MRCAFVLCVRAGVRAHGGNEVIRMHYFIHPKKTSAHTLRNPSSALCVRACVCTSLCVRFLLLLSLLLLLLSLGRVCVRVCMHVRPRTYLPNFRFCVEAFGDDACALVQMPSEPRPCRVRAYAYACVLKCVRVCCNAFGCEPPTDIRAFYAARWIWCIFRKVRA